MSATHIEEVKVENILEEFNFYLFEVPYKDTLGYGYYLEYNGLRIKQEEIPAAPGIIPFKTHGEALKIAYLVAYRLKNEQGMPAITTWELGFFNIETEW
ncbi:MAG: DUF4907 domain-containing protein [Candidatus Cyclobacteriaceae bacterium M2_1C_046]